VLSRQAIINLSLIDNKATLDALRRPSTPPATLSLLGKAIADKGPLFFSHATDPAPGGKYRHWEDLRHIAPPGGLTKEEYWAAVKLARRQGRRDLSLMDPSGKPFSFISTDHVWEMLHKIDQGASGENRVLEPITNPSTRDRYLQSSLIQEALTSSQIEGAVATREQAKALIRGNRQPVTRHERMVYNNYRALSVIRDQLEGPLTPDLVSEIHSVITDGTIDEKYRHPYYRTEGDGIAVCDEITGEIYYSPPSAKEIPQRMQALCAFANQENATKFVHPVVRAILLHFWLAIDHPFVDGNGRTARALFYWSMLKSGYWLTEYISISSIIKQSQSSYNAAFLFAESDERDATYFLDHQLRVILRALDSLHVYLAKKTVEVRMTEDLLHKIEAVNHRQLALLSHALRHPGERYTISSHQISHRVSYGTARSDLLKLASSGLLEAYQSGRQLVYIAPDDLNDRLKHPRLKRRRK